MSLDDIQLGPFLVQHLYKHSIVDLDTIKKNGMFDVPQIPFLGKNENGILVLVNEAYNAFLPDADLQLLTGILTACNLSLADIALVNVTRNEGLEFNGLMKEFSPRLVILFGVKPDQLAFPLHFPHFQLQQYNNQTYLSAPSLKTLSEDKSQKKEFWISLQKHFF